MQKAVDKLLDVVQPVTSLALRLSAAWSAGEKEQSDFDELFLEAKKAAEQVSASNTTPVKQQSKQNDQSTYTTTEEIDFKKPYILGNSSSNHRSS